VAEVRLYTGHPRSGLARLSQEDDEAEPPYWAYPWGGGIVLARHILDHPQAVAGLRVVDLGCGGGLVAIAAMKAGAASVLAVDIDPFAVAATELNAGLNGVEVETFCADLRSVPKPCADLILVGDLFYDTALAGHVTTFLDRAAIRTLIGDPGRLSLPRGRLRSIADYAAADFASAGGLAEVFAWVS
jgi:predicted nicotinamide N-methyase